MPCCKQNSCRGKPLARHWRTRVTMYSLRSIISIIFGRNAKRDHSSRKYAVGRADTRISPRLVAGPIRAVRTFRQIAIPRWEWSKRKLGIALLACPHAIAMGVSGILRGYLGTLAQPQHKVSVYLAVYRALCKRRKSISR